jgi:hypothetical protein
VHGGCAACRTEYCYRCLGTAEENVRLRGDKKHCVCGFWSNFCKPLQGAAEIEEHLALTPYPHDPRRCGCAVCPECREGKPCVCARGIARCARGGCSPAPPTCERPPRGRRRPTPSAASPSPTGGSCCGGCSPADVPRSTPRTWRFLRRAGPAAWATWRGPWRCPGSSTWTRPTRPTAAARRSWSRPRPATWRWGAVHCMPTYKPLDTALCLFLPFSCCLQVCRALLAHGASPNRQEHVGGHTAVHLVTRHGHIEETHVDVVRVLCEHGADPNLPGRFDVTPLHRVRRCLPSAPAWHHPPTTS